MSDEEELRQRGPCLSRKEKGKAVVGEEVEDDQINEPGPGSGDDSYSPLGPHMRLCFSKSLTSPEVNPEGPILYLNAYETSILLNSPDIITSPDSVSLPRKLNVFDIQNNLYIMLLSPCARSGWTGYSITTGWDIYVSHRNMGPGEEVSFHRSRDIDSYSYAYNYVLVKKSDKLEIVPQIQAADYVRREPRGPGSRNMDEVALCLSKNLTSDDLDEQKPRLNFTATEAFRLTSRAELLNDDPGRFSEELIVFDHLDNRYRMKISNLETGSLSSFIVNTEWGKYLRGFDLKEDDVLEIYRFSDLGRFYYALKPIRKVLPHKSYCLSSNIIVEAFDEDGVGRLRNPCTGVKLLYKTSSFEEDLPFGFFLTHQNYIRVLHCDRDGAFVRLCYLWTDSMSSLRSYISYKSVLCQCYFSCDKPSTFYLTISESFKSLIKEMIVFVVDVHKKKKCMRGFHIEDLGVVDEGDKHTILFCGVVFYHADLKKKWNDFRSIALIIKDIMPGWANIVLLKNLVDKLETCNCDEDVYLICNHLVLMTSTEQVMFIRNVHEKKLHNEHAEFQKYVSSLKAIGSNYGWTSKFCSHSQGKGPLFDCFRYSERGYFDSMHEIERSNESLFGFSRNLTAHAKQTIDKARSKKSVVHAEVTDDHVACLVLSQFEKELVRFEEQLHHNGILHYFIGGSSPNGGVGRGGIGTSGGVPGGSAESGVVPGGSAESGVVPGGSRESGMGPGRIGASAVDPGGVGASGVMPKYPPVPASRGIRDLNLKLTKLLSAHQGNIVGVCFDDSDALVLTGCTRVLGKYPLGTVLMTLEVYDEGDTAYDMVLTHMKRDDGAVTCTLDGGWHRLVATHGLKVGDWFTINRIQGKLYYVVSYTRSGLTSYSTEIGVGPGGSAASKKKPVVASRGIRDPNLKITKALSAQQGNIVKLCFDASEAWHLTGCPRIFENYPFCTNLMNLVVYDQEDRPYDMVLTQTKLADGEIICTLDGGWYRLVATHGLKAGDRVTISRIQGELYYVLSYTRAGSLSGIGARGVGPSSVGASGSA